MTVTDSLVLDPQQTRTVAAAFERLFPADEHGPGAADIGVVAYLDTALAGAEAEHVATYRAGLAALDQAALSSFAQTFVQCAPAAQDALIARLERDELADVPAAADGRTFFELLRAHLQEGLFA
ncbi:MAG: gluconate 2-dehydrogenase subunit 3 family protein, partial [Chloroflexi bacterium]